MCSVFSWLKYLSGTHCLFLYTPALPSIVFSVLTPCSSSAIPTGPKSFLVLLRAVWWRTTRSDPRQSSSWSTPSSETNPTRGKSAFSSKTTSTVPRRRGERRVRMSLCSSLSFFFSNTENLGTFKFVLFWSCTQSDSYFVYRWDRVWVQW